MRLPELLVRAGLAGRVEPAAVIAAKWVLLAAGAVIGLVAAPAVTPRLGVVVVGVLTVAGFLAPDAALHRLAARRRERLVGALPDTLDMLAVGAASGRDPAAAFGEIAAGTTGRWPPSSQPRPPRSNAGRRRERRSRACANACRAPSSAP